jgi:hypothetical protein
MPTRAKLERIGLKSVADELENLKCLGTKNRGDVVQPPPAPLGTVAVVFNS